MCMQQYLFLPVRYLILITILCWSIIHQHQLESVTTKEGNENFSSIEIRPYISVLSKLAKRCHTFTEIGMNNLLITQGILQNLSNQSTAHRYYLSIDLEYPDEKQLKRIEQLAKKKNIDFAFWRINDMHI